MKIRQLLPQALLFLLVLTQACDYTDEVIDPEQPIVDIVLLHEDENLQSLVDRINQASSTSGRSNALLSDVNFEQAMKSTDPHTGTVKHSFAMHSDNGLIMRKFILSKTINQELIGHVYVYEVDLDWLVNRGSFPGWHKYNGSFKVLDLEGAVIVENQIMDGKSITTDTKNGRGSGITCVTSTEIRYASSPRSPDYSYAYYVTVTNCYVTGSSTSDDNDVPDFSMEGSSGPETGPTYFTGDECCSIPSVALCNEGYVRDNNGNCVNELALLEAQLQNLLEENPFALLDIDCDQIEKWQALAQHKPSRAVIDKLNNLDENYTSIIAGDWDVQYIEDASGPVVNMDYFPVTITQLPNDPATGQTFSPEGFFNYVRTNLNDFFEDNSTTFGSYNETEGTIWGSSNYLGAIMRFEIHLILGMSQDGSVICSNQNSSSWTFTTIESPFDWSHPVSGNREFGLNQNLDGSFTFFTRGVDRVAESTDEFMGNLPLMETAFDGGEELWAKLQDNIESFVNDPINGGKAQKQTPTINRPNWEDVMDVLNGEKPISDLGCE
jgi:hypothetical protein